MALSRRTKALLAAVGVVLAVLAPVAVVVAEDILSGFIETSGEVHVKADNGPEVFWDAGYNISQGNAFTDNSFNLSTENNGQVNFSSPSSGGSLKVTQINGTFTNVTSADVTAANVTINPDDKQEVAIGGAMTELEFTNMTPDDGNTDFIYSATGSATLRITDLDADTQYGAVGSNNRAIDVAETDGSGELTFTDLESNANEPITLQELGELEIRNESAPHELVTNADVEVKFYEEEDDNPTIVNRTASGGIVDLTGLPVDEQFVVTVRADGYHYRTIIIEDLAQQETAFVINESVDSRQVTFTIDDDTGQFTGSDAEILIEHAINESLYGSGGFSWMNAAGEQTGAIDSATFWMAHEERYRVKVRAGSDTRILGAFTPTANETVILRPSLPGVNVTDEQGYAWNASVNTTDAQAVIFEYNDPDDATTDLRVRIFESGNESNEIYNQLHAGPHGYLKITQPLTAAQANKTWAVNFSATRNGETISGKQVTGRQVIPTIGELDDVWKHAVAVGVVILVGALFSVRNVGVGAVSTAFVGGGFWMAGWLPDAAGGAIMVALVGAVLYKTQEGRFG